VKHDRLQLSGTTVSSGEAAREEPTLVPPATSPTAWSLSDAYAYCRRVTRRSSSNFYHAFRLLPAERHNALCAFYAFCRFLDDITDQPAAPPVNEGGNTADRLQALLDAWREELQRCYAGTPRHQISWALADTVRRFPIAREHLAGIIDGVAMDLYRTRYATFGELYDYCYRVASLVGLVCIEILGYRNPTARAYAVNLGVAFQLTNILRDVGEDARRGRIYLPQEDLARCGYTEQELTRGVYNDAFLRVMQFEGERARAYYQEAVRNLAPEDRRSLAAAEAMRLIYWRLLDKLIAERFAVFGKRVALPNSYKICLALAAWVRGQLPF
jgi:phytoene synthase